MPRPPLHLNRGFHFDGKKKKEKIKKKSDSSSRPIQGRGRLARDRCCVVLTAGRQRVGKFSQNITFGRASKGGPSYEGRLRCLYCGLVAATTKLLWGSGKMVGGWRSFGLAKRPAFIKAGDG